MENADAVAESCDREKVVGNIENRGAHLAVQACEQIQDFGLCDWIEGAGRFVCEEECRAVKDSHGDADSLTLANA